MSFTIRKPIQIKLKSSASNIGYKTGKVTRMIPIGFRNMPRAYRPSLGGGGDAAIDAADDDRYQHRYWPDGDERLLVFYTVT